MTFYLLCFTLSERFDQCSRTIVANPDGPRLAAYTRQVVSNTPLPGGGGSDGVRARQASAIRSAPFRKIKHVLYIIRENRTCDQVFGDMAKGNGDPGLTLFGRDATPNAHALAQKYVLMDNLYCNGEVSEDGHEWCNAAYATDFTQRAWPVNYSGLAEPDADERLTSSPAGYLWDNCARHGLSYYSYGEFVSFKSSPKTQPVYTGPKALGGHASLAWSQFSYDRHDTEKTGVFLADLHRAEKTGVWPRYQVMSLGGGIIRRGPRLESIPRWPMSRPTIRRSGRSSKRSRIRASGRKLRSS